MRESKGPAALLLVDTQKAGAGMDGIYSAAREVEEAVLFKAALGLAAREITLLMSSDQRKYSENAVKKARGYGCRFSVVWTEFDFLSVLQQARNQQGCALFAWLWPLQKAEKQEDAYSLDVSRMFVDRLLSSRFPECPLQGGYRHYIC